MKSTTRTRTTKPPSKRAVRDLPVRKGQDAKAGESWLNTLAHALGGPDVGLPSLQHEATHQANNVRS
jgi:hypothetical protein